MKKSTTIYVAVAAALLFAVLLANFWSPFHGNPGHVVLDWDSDTYDGPLGTVVGALIGGAGLLIGAVALGAVAAVVGVVMAGVGVAMVTVFAVCVLLAAALAIPFSLPLLVPLAIVWFIVSRIRRNRIHSTAV